MLKYLLVFAIPFIVLFLFQTLKKGKGGDLGTKLDDAIGFNETKVEQERPLTKKEIRHKKLQIELIRAGFPLKPAEFERFRLFGTLFVFLVFFLLAKNVILGLIFAVVVFMLPNIYLKFAQERKKLVFENQIPIALSLVRNSVEAGFSFMQALEVVASEMEPPVSEEFGRVLHETNVGIDLEVALNNMLERITSDELKLVVIAVLIQRQVGGNLGEIIEIILETIRDRIQIKGEIRTLTSQGRLSAMIICGLPVVLGLIMYMINPEYMSPLITTDAGQVMLGVAGFMIFLGAYLISKIIKIDF